MDLTIRQEKILSALIDEYVKNAEPVSSKLLSKKKGFKVCPATIRNELQALTDMGYIHQPHTSAGRAPTAKAYRFFVNKLFCIPENLFFNSYLGELQEMEKHVSNELKFFETITKNLAQASSNLVLTYLPQSDCVLKEGWEELFQHPEFKEKTYLDRFIEEVEALEENIKKIGNQSKDNKVNVYIGQEKPLLNSEDFSLIVSQGNFPNNEKGIVAIFGPSRMEYEKNIGLMQSLINLLDNL